MLPPVFGVLFDGIAYGMLLFVLSVGLSVTLGLMNFVNLAHCAFAMVGGYVTATLVNDHGWPFLATLPAAFLVAALVSVAIAAVFFPTQAGVVGVIVALFVMIMLHELGHFVVAKRSGMKVTEFFIGFGPRVWSVRKGETEYGLKAFPLGGYCRIIGMTNLEEVEPDDEQRAYRSKRFLPKLGVALAGSTMHFIIAFVLIFIVLAGSGDWFSDPHVNTVVHSVEGPSGQAAMHPGDTIVAISAVSADATATHLVGNEPHTPTASWELCHAAVHAAESLGQPVHVGSVASSDLFYNPDEGQYGRWSKRGVLAVEMEAAALFTVAALKGVRGACLLLVSDMVIDGSFTRISDAEMRAAVDRTTRIALAVAIGAPAPRTPV